MGMESVFKLSVLLNLVDRMSSPMEQAAKNTQTGINKINTAAGTMQNSTDAISAAGTAVDDLSGQVKKASQDAGESISRLNSAFGTMQKAGGIMAATGATIAGAGAKIVTSTFDTQNALGELHSLGVEDLKAVETAAKSFSDTWAGTAKSDFITAAYDIKSGIASLTDEGVAGFTDLAALTGKATKSTTEEMGSLFATGYGIYKGFYDDLSDLEFGEMFSAGIATAVKNYKTSGSQMAASISMLGATATNNNVPLAEQLAILGQLQTTMSGSEAATKYKAFLNQAAKAGSELGLAFTDANNQLLSTPEILDALKSKYGDTIDAVEKQELKKAFGTDEAVAMIDLLYQNVDSLRTGVDDLAGSMKQGTDVTREMAEAINNTPEQKFQVIRQQIHNNTEELAQGLLPVVNDTMDKVSGLIKKGSDWISSNQSLVQSITYMGIALAAFLLIGGGILTMVGTVGKAVLGLRNTINLVKGAVAGMNTAFLASPVTWVVAGIAALVAIFILLWNRSEAFRSFWLSLFDQVRAAVLGAWQSIQPSLRQLGAALMELWQSVQPLMQVIEAVGAVVLTVIAGIFMGALKGAARAVAPLVDALTNVVQFTTNMVNAVVALFAGDFTGAVDFAAAAVDNLKDFFVNSFDAILSFADGFVSGFLDVVGGALSMIGIDASETIESMKNTVKSGLEAVKGFSGSILEAAGDTVKEKLNNIKKAYEEHGGGVSGIAAAAMEGIKGYYTAGFTFIDNLTGGKLSEIADKFTDRFSGIQSTVSDAVSGVKGKIISGMGQARDNADRQLAAMRNSYKEAGGGFQGAMSAAMTGIRGIVGSGFNVLNTLTGGRLETIRETMGSKMEEAKETVVSIFEGIRSGIQQKLDSAKQTVQAGIERIKGFFKFEWSLPTLKLPHIDISGKWSLDPPSVPKFGVKWYREGGILDGAQIFGQAGGNLLGGGEAGKEAVLPLSELWKNMRIVMQGVLRDEDQEDRRETESIGSRVTNFFTSKSTVFRKETETRETRETVAREKETRETKERTQIIVNIYPKMEEIADLKLLFGLVNELKDAQNWTDDVVTE